MTVKSKGVKATPTPPVSGGKVPPPTGWTAKRLAAQKGGK